MSLRCFCAFIFVKISFTNENISFFVNRKDCSDGLLRSVGSQGVVVPVAAMHKYHFNSPVVANRSHDVVLLNQKMVLM